MKKESINIHRLREGIGKYKKRENMKGVRRHSVKILDKFIKAIDSIHEEPTNTVRGRGGWRTRKREMILGEN